ncbi:alpha-ketoglutarate-dependent dioxygenase AlkB [Luteimonas aestuarii]|uniref:Alpha-ketoglutarate-dependent dioxygenase AlkB n=1 Tax=Luteimonas aestuarii TaxID=453837 RepID=A0A4R5TK47_9GAMM|nr:alpha-ketoglutarate-dependent dioxygenase AlkB [Luteimonas aestuarii]TDK19418.1 alpha-ketoglutarate-dependent dioxygenase AlkB [Luteimonas aestuarii]
MASLAPIRLEGADVALHPAWLEPADADALLCTLRDDLPWETHHVRLFGRDVPSPRLSCWIGDAGTSYRYSGVRHQPLPWTEPLQAVRWRLERETGHRFNSVLANLYRDGRDAMGWHSDDEPELGPRPVIASVSLGGTRRFVLKHREVPTRKLNLPLPHGSLLLMRGDTQRNYRHALPRTALSVLPRINLTFRHVHATP